MDIVKESNKIHHYNGLYINHRYYKVKVGFPAFKDSRGNQYYTGDIVEVYNHKTKYNSTCIITCSDNNMDDFFIMGYAEWTKKLINHENKDYDPIKIVKRYYEIKEGDYNHGLKITREDIS